MTKDSKVKVYAPTVATRGTHLRQELKSTDIKEAWVDEYGIDENVELTYTKPRVVLQRKVGRDGTVSYHVEPYRSSTPSQAWQAPGASLSVAICVSDGVTEAVEAKLKSSSWAAEVITLSGNIDCYHPVERKVKSTRKLLEMFLKYKHPVRIVTRHTLILRDMDLLTQLAKHDLVEVCVPVATLHRELDSALDSKGASLQRRMQMVKMLSSRGIPVSVRVAPIVPGLNDEGIFTLVKVAAAHGATSVVPTVHHVVGSEAVEFKEWARSCFPYRWRQIVRRVEEKHRAVLLLTDPHERKRKVKGIVADIFGQFQMAANAYGLHLHARELNTKLYNGTAAPQMSFF